MDFLQVEFSSLAIGLAFLISFGVAFVIGPKMLPFLTRLKQTVREDGPTSHLSKNGTPTMGGFIFVISTLAAILLLGRYSREMLLAVIYFLAFGLVGFLDDYIKVVMKRSLGLRAYQKILLQVFFALSLAFYQLHNSIYGSGLPIPFVRGVTLELGFLYVPFIAMVIVAVVNSVNLTDGLDGLSSGVTFFVALFFSFGSAYYGYTHLAIFMSAVAGGCLGFLRVNRYPAQVFMGDTGSMALGGAVAAGAVISNLTLFIPLVGLIYLLESLSVILQVGSYKLFKKRIFKMAPLHHHFELSGWKETKVVKVFYMVTLFLCILGAWGLR